MALSFLQTLKIYNSEMLEQILSYFVFNDIEIVGLSVVLLSFVIQMWFYFIYYKKPYSFAKKEVRAGNVSNTSKPKVSVIIASENEVDELKENLPLILEQDYLDYEVIVVNNGSTDESDELLISLNTKYSHLYHTYVPGYSIDTQFGRRKLAFTIGIKAAKGDILLFIEPYSKPVSNKWISTMVESLGEDKDVVLGYSFYKNNSKFYNRVARFDNLLFSLQYLSSAIKKKGYTGTYRNILFRKNLFFERKGFASCLGAENAEDVFINRIIDGDNTVVAISQDSFVETHIERFSVWKQIKKSYSLAKSFYKSKAPFLFNIESSTRYIFYIFAVISMGYSVILQNWALLGIFAFLFLFRLIVQLILLNKSAKYFCSGKFYFSLLLLDILQPIYNMNFRTRHRRGWH